MLLLTTPLRRPSPAGMDRKKRPEWTGTGGRNHRNARMSGDRILPPAACQRTSSNAEYERSTSRRAGERQLRPGLPCALPATSASTQGHGTSLGSAAFAYSLVRVGSGSNWKCDLWLPTACGPSQRAWRISLVRRRINARSQGRDAPADVHQWACADLKNLTRTLSRSSMQKGAPPPRPAMSGLF